MNRRPNEIEEAIDLLDNSDLYDCYIAAWGTIYEYIEYLEETIQDLSDELKRTFDDGK